jgi:probable F420-dependent oxidoreductase
VGLTSFGVHVATFPDEPRRFGELCVKIEDLGFSSIWLADGLTRKMIDPLPGLAYASALTDRVKLGTCVYVIPVRHPVITAKLTATVDRLSGGRFIFGVGVGWKEEEFQASGQSFERRGEITDECLEIISQAWKKDEINFQGNYYKLSGVRMQIHPTQRPQVWVGGNGRHAATRAARFGNCWIPTDYTVQEYEENVKVYRNACARLSRDAVDVNVASHLMLIIDEDRGRADVVARSIGESVSTPLEDVRKWAIVGDPTEVVRRIEAYNTAGVNYHVFNFASNGRDDASIELFAREVLPSFT